MLFSCSKLVRDKLEKEIFIEIDTDPFFIWNLHEIQIGHKKGLIFMNELTQFNIIVYGIKKIEYSNINKLFIDSLTRTLMGYGFHEDAVKQYLKQDNKVFFRSTKDKKSISRLNKVCMTYKDMYYYGKNFDDNAKSVIRILNQYPFRYQFPIELIVKEFNERYNLAISFDAYRILVELIDENDTITRDLVLPIDTDCKRLHEYIQALFGWTNSHLHQFTFYDQSIEYRVKMNEIEDDFEDFYKQHNIKSINETDICISDILKLNNEFIYDYDFGRGWQCKIVLVEKLENCDLIQAKCYNAQGIVDLEDEKIQECMIEYYDYPIIATLKDYLDICLKNNSSLFSINSRLDNYPLFI